MPAFRQHERPVEDDRILGELVVGDSLDVFELPLNECEAGEEGIVVALDTDAGLASRLRELGLVPGAVIRIARTGSPMIVEVGNSRFCLRGEEASRVVVRIALGPGAIPAMAGVEFSLE